jgi:hypothetical protein
MADHYHIGILVDRGGSFRIQEVLRDQVPAFRGLSPKNFGLPIVFSPSGSHWIEAIGLKLPLMSLDCLFNVSLQRNQLLILFGRVYSHLHLSSSLTLVQAVSKDL